MDSLATFPQFDSFTLNAIFRLAVAALFGGALGFERMMKMRAASIRTYSLVCVGSAMTIPVSYTHLAVSRIARNRTSEDKNPAAKVPEG